MEEAFSNPPRNVLKYIAPLRPTKKAPCGAFFVLAGLITYLPKYTAFILSCVAVWKNSRVSALSALSRACMRVFRDRRTARIFTDLYYTLNEKQQKMMGQKIRELFKEKIEGDGSEFHITPKEVRAIYTGLLR